MCYPHRMSTPVDRDDLFLSFAKQNGLSPEELDLVFSEIGDSVGESGLAHCLLSAGQMRTFARLCVTVAGTMAYGEQGERDHEVWAAKILNADFVDPESTAGQKRRDEFVKFVRLAKSSMSEARQQLAQAAVFRALFRGEARPADVVDVADGDALPADDFASTVREIVGDPEPVDETKSRREKRARRKVIKKERGKIQRASEELDGIVEHVGA